MRILWVTGLMALVLAGCGGGGGAEEAKPAAEAARKTAVVPKGPKPADESTKFPLENQVSVKMVEEKLLGKDFLPGGNIADYKRGTATYQLFIAKFKTPNEAAIALFDYKSKMAEPKLVATFGGYYGLDGAHPSFVFTKGSYLLGVVGLIQSEADLVAREFAARVKAD